MASRPANHLVKAILVTLFCCLPLGIASIVQAARVDGAYHRGDPVEAERLSQAANNYANIAIGLGVVVFLFYFMLGLVGGI